MKQLAFSLAFIFMSFASVWGQTIVLNETFDSAIPSDWIIADADNDGYTWKFESYSGHNATGTAKTAKNYSTSNHDDWLILPRQILHANQTLAFWAKSNNSFGTSHPEDFRVMVSKTDSAVSSFDLEIADENSISSNWTEYSYTLTDHANIAPGDTVYIAIHNDTQTGNGYYMYLDDLTLSYPSPYDFSVTAPQGVEVHTQSSYDYTVTIHNEGSSDDEFFPNITDNGNWNYSLYLDDGSTSFSSPLTIPGHTSKNFIVRVDVPENAAMEEKDTVTIDVISAEGSKAEESFSIVTTAMVPMTVPHQENFDEVSAPDIPSGWKKLNNSGTTTTILETYQDTSAPSQPNLFRFYNYYETDSDLMLISPPVESFSNNHLLFNAKGSGETTIEVGIISNPSDGSTFQKLATKTLSEGWQEYTVDFSGYTGDNKYIVFRHGLANTLQNIYIDDVSWEQKNANDASVLSVNNPSGRFVAEEKDVVVTIENNGTATLTEVDVEWQVNGSSQTVYNWSGSLAPNGTEEVNLGSYDFSSGGNFTIAANTTQPNGNTDETTTNDTARTTVFANAPITAPYTQDFDDVNVPEIPVSWEKVVQSSSSNLVVESSSNMAYTGNQSIKMYNYGDLSSGLYLVSPPVDSFAGNRLKIHLGGVDNGTVNIGTMSDPTDATTFEEFKIFTISYEFAEYIVDFYNYSGSDDYIAIKHGNSGTYQSIYIDHFVWEEVPVINDEPRNFGYVAAEDTSEVQHVRVTNVGASNLQIAPADIQLKGDNPGQFIADISTTIDLSTGQSADIPVYFTPDTSGHKYAKLAISTSKANYEIALSGKAIPENSLVEYFEGDEFPPTGWDKPANYNWQQKANASIEGNYSAYHSSDVYDIFATPKLEINGGDSLIFKARNSTYGGSLSIMISSDRQTWDHLKDIALTDTETEYKVSFSASEEGEKYVGFRANKYVYLDEVIGPVKSVIGHDASLSDITLDGAMLDGFHPDTLSYNVMLSSDASSAPTIDVTTNDPDAYAEITQATTVPGFAFVNVTAEDSTTERQYEIYFEQTEVKDSTLKDLKVDGASIEGFRKDSLHYSMNLPYGTTSVPEVEAIPTDPMATVTVNNATEIPGTTNVEVVSSDGNHDQVYTIAFSTKPAKTLTFFVKDSLTADPLENAEIIVEPTLQLTTGTDGKVSLDTASGLYYYSVNKDGYDIYSDSAELNENNLTETIMLAPTEYTITFQVADTAGALSDAIISIGSTELVTDAQGMATIDTINGSYDYTVSLDGYDQYSGTIEVAGNTLTENIVLDQSEYNLTFEVKDQNATGLTGAHIQIEDNTLITGSDGIVTLDTVSGNYSYTVSLDGYEPVSGMVEVTNSAISETVTMEECEYNVTLEVVNNQSEALADATVQIGDRVITTDDNGIATLDTVRGNYAYTVSHAGYEEVSGTIEITDSDVTQSVTLQEIEYVVTIEVIDGQSEPLEGASVQIGGQTLLTNGTGIATLDTLNGSYSYTVSLNGYEESTGVIELSGSDLTETVTLTEQEYTITFKIVDDNSNVVPNAVVNCGHAQLSVNNNGVAHLDTTNGEYEYAVTAEGYNKMTGTVVVQSSNQTEQVVLPGEATKIHSISSDAFKVYPNPSDGKFVVESETPGGRIAIYDLSGHVILEKKLDQKTLHVDIPDYAPGMYIIKIRQKGKVFKNKLIKK